MTISIHTDGASRGNPGPAAISYVIEGLGEKIEHAETIGTTTNNQAEYQAMLAALTRLQQDCPAGALVECFSDSELMVKQLNGEYRMKDEKLRPHFTAIKEVLTALEKRDVTITLTAVRREQNKRADELGNQALDGKL